jgi:uncharacterized protein YdaU (DUF1376 family)
MKSNSYYFSHDYNAANDVKVLFLRQQLGMEGYGIYWYLVEALALSGGILPMNITPVLAMQMQVTEAKVDCVIRQFNLFVIDNETFFSMRLAEHLKLRKTLSDKGKEGANRRWGNGVANGGGNANKEKKTNEINAFVTKISI